MEIQDDPFVSLPDKREWRQLPKFMIVDRVKPEGEETMLPPSGFVLHCHEPRCLIEVPLRGNGVFLIDAAEDDDVVAIMHSAQKFYVEARPEIREWI